MIDSKETLSDLRNKIDDIDTQIVNLLKERISVVDKVGEYKRKSGSSPSFIRSGREASMARNLIERLGDEYPASAILSIWRNIISSSLVAEQGLNIDILSIDGSKSQGYWLAREYFGSFCPINISTNIDDILENIKNKDGAVAIFPSPDTNKECWWKEWLNRDDMPSIFAMIPFISDNSDRYLAAAYLIAEPSELDVSLVAIRISKDLDVEYVVRHFARDNIITEVVSEYLEDNSKCLLLKYNGFISSNDRILENIANNIGNNTIIKVIGSYASQINL